MWHDFELEEKSLCGGLFREVVNGVSLQRWFTSADCIPRFLHFSINLEKKMQVYIIAEATVFGFEGRRKGEKFLGVFLHRQRFFGLCRRRKFLFVFPILNLFCFNLKQIYFPPEIFSLLVLKSFCLFKFFAFPMKKRQR